MKKRIVSNGGFNGRLGKLETSGKFLSEAWHKFFFALWKKLLPPNFFLVFVDVLFSLDFLTF